MNKSNKEQLSYAEQLEAKGIHFSQHRTCSGCMALTALNREEMVFPVGPANPSLTDEEFRKYGLFGECDLGFSQDWHGCGRATPLEPCPKPKTEKLYFKCIGKID